MADEFAQLATLLAQIDQEDVLADQVEELYTFPRVIVREDGVYVAQSPYTTVKIADAEERKRLGLQVGDDVKEFTVTEMVHGERTFTYTRGASFST